MIAYRPNEPASSYTSLTFCELLTRIILMDLSCVFDCIYMVGFISCTEMAKSCNTVVVFNLT